ncbi:DUF4231 domain-containing protein [Actinoplanes sp. NPDC049668]|uniref:DUF4231 domain-containing protein n=1 Tax=unclassified Actinoplanes TaxID=2626549 RepID=UPI0033ABCFC5
MRLPSTLAYGALCQAASAAARAGQFRYLRAVRVRLIALVIAATGGALSWQVGEGDVWAWIAFIGFLVALAAEVVLLATHPERKWFEGRAAAESAKTLSWRYGVGGAPFPIDRKPNEMHSAFLEQIAAIARTLQGEFPTPIDGSKLQITPQMEGLRKESFAQRKEAYLVNRIQNQRNWYEHRSRAAERNGNLFLIGAIALEFAGVLAAALRVAAVIRFDLLGIISAIVAGLAAWSQTRQYGSTARAYALAANELSLIETKTGLVAEADWPPFVAEAEAAISREHTLWTALHRP